MLRVEPVGNVASLVDLATLNGDVCADQVRRMALVSALAPSIVAALQVIVTP